MGKFDTWSITCKFCNWEWETCSFVIAQHPKCPECESTNCFVEKNEVMAIKDKGKIVADIPVDLLNNDDSILIDGYVLTKTMKTDKPLVVIKKDEFGLDNDLSNEEKREIIKKVDDVKSKLIKDIIDNEL